MAQKNNIRSIRFSDELADLIDRQTGSTFTQKFENLITRCVWELPQKEEQLRQIEKQIDQERQRLADLQKTTVKLHQLNRYINLAQEYIEAVERQAKDIADTMEEKGM